MDRTPTILIADDDPSIVKLLKYMLRPFNCRILEAADGEQALQVAQHELPDVALLDVQMPKRSGWEVCQTLKAVQRTSGIAVVLITGKGDVRDRLTGLQLGADDYLVKPFKHEQVVKRIGTLLTRRPDAEPAERPLETENVPFTVLNDPATGLPTVPLLLERIREQLIEKRELGIVFIDVEQFELIEAEHGWAFFDEFLRTVAGIIQEEAKRFFGDAVVVSNRVGGSSFYVFYDPATVAGGDVEVAARRLNDSLLSATYSRFPNLRSGQVGFFVGVSHAEYEPSIRLERQIYRGMQRAADAVRDAELQRRRLLMRELREIVRRRRITTVFQPIVYASDGSIFGYEVLTRGPKQSLFRNSDMLFSFAREMHLLWDLEELALQCAVERLKKAHLNDWKFLVNLEAEMFENDQFRLHAMMEFFEEHKGHFVFELTERAAIEDYAAFRELLEEFRKKGIEIAIDDAGSGYASLEAIAALAPDYLKITKSLVSSVPNEPIKQDLLAMLVELGKKTGAKTLAEGIETVEEYEWCSRLGIDLLQGYYIGKPSEELAAKPLFAS